MKKTSNQLCNCLEKNNITSFENIDPCLREIILRNSDNILKYYKVKTFDKLDLNEMGNKIITELAKECDYIIPYMVDPINRMDKNSIPDKNIECSKIKKGEFYYLNSNAKTGISDTTFVSIKNNTFRETMKNGRTYSLLDIKWKSGCRFDLLFKESNDSFKNALSKKGDKYEYEIISKTLTSYIIKMKWKKSEYKFELYRIE